LLANTKLDFGPGGIDLPFCLGLPGGMWSKSFGIGIITLNFFSNFKDLETVA
jgi:hypothetical protein